MTVTVWPASSPVPPPEAAGLPLPLGEAGGAALEPPPPAVALGEDALDEQAATTRVMAARMAAIRDRRMPFSSILGSPLLDHRPGRPGRSPGLRWSGPRPRDVSRSPPPWWRNGSRARSA